MKISILLPYKENFSPEYPGAVSLFVNDTSKLSKYKKNIIIYGNTNYKKTFNLNYKNNYILYNKNKIIGLVSYIELNKIHQLKKEAIFYIIKNPF